MDDINQTGLDPELRFLLRPDVEIEDFQEKSLVLRCDAMRMYEINSGARRLLTYLDGKRTVRDMMDLYISETDIPFGEAAEIIMKSLSEMERQGIVMRLFNEKPNIGRTKARIKYIINPDAVFWQDKDEEASLFIPDTGSSTVINSTAIMLWDALAVPKTLPELVSCLCAVFPRKRLKQVEKDIREFLDHMIKMKFIDELELS